jgi:hypothetical protein
MNLLGTANKWRDLGISTSIGKYSKEISQVKIIKDIRSIENIDTEEILFNNGYNVLILEISKSNIFCIDIDNVDDSIKNFHNILDLNQSVLDDFFHEKTRNGGYHLYFRSKEKHRNIIGNFYSGIRIDILLTGRVFTSPSSFNWKSYSFGKIKPDDLKSINDIMEMPEWLDYILCNPD